MGKWRQKYTNAIEVFGFVEFVDGSFTRYTETMNIVGSQKARRKRTWVEVRIGIPEKWWCEEEPAYKLRLVIATEEGFHSMIELLKGKPASDRRRIAFGGLGDS